MPFGQRCGVLPVNGHPSVVHDPGIGQYRGPARNAAEDMAAPCLPPKPSRGFGVMKTDRIPASDDKRKVITVRRCGDWLGFDDDR